MEGVVYVSALQYMHLAIESSIVWTKNKNYDFENAYKQNVFVT